VSDQDDIEPTPARAVTGDDEIRALLARLGRPNRAGGHVIERAALVAEGADFDVIMRWIEANGGKAETLPAARSTGGLHSARAASNDDRKPLRFVVPTSALG
jgi:hypothetical protein